MKMKKIAAILLVTVMTMGSLSGCGDKTEQGQTVSGTVDAIKDFMFIIEASDGAFYSFPLNSENPIDLTGISTGDEITIEYEGTLSEVDPFDGKVISVEKE